MRIVLDSNILFSALIKDSFVRRIILEYEGKFLFPYIIFEELLEHKDELIMKSGIERGDFDYLLSKLLRRVEVVLPEVLDLNKNKALEIMKNIDRDDVIFVACALAHPESFICCKYPTACGDWVFATLKIPALIN